MAWQRGEGERPAPTLPGGSVRAWASLVGYGGVGGEAWGDHGAPPGAVVRGSGEGPQDLSRNGPRFGGCAVYSALRCRVWAATPVVLLPWRLVGAPSLGSQRPSKAVNPRAVVVLPLSLVSGHPST